METFGNKELLDLHKIGYLAGSKIAPLSVFPSLDWASEVAKREDIAVASGFHSMLERQVLDLLLHGHCGIICVLARKLYSKVPPEYHKAFLDGRILFLTEEKCIRVSKDSATRRNRLVVSLSDELVIPTISPESSLASIITAFNNEIKML